VGTRAGRDEEEKISHQCPCRELNPGRPAHSLITALIEINRFSK